MLARIFHDSVIPKQFLPRRTEHVAMTCDIFARDYRAKLFVCANGTECVRKPRVLPFMVETTKNGSMTSMAIVVDFDNG